MIIVLRLAAIDINHHYWLIYSRAVNELALQDTGVIIICDCFSAIIAELCRKRGAERFGDAPVAVVVVTVHPSDVDHVYIGKAVLAIVVVSPHPVLSHIPAKVIDRLYAADGRILIDVIAR